MPFASKAQRAYLFLHHPDVAKEFAKNTSEEQEKKLSMRRRKLLKRRKK